MCPNPLREARRPRAAQTPPVAPPRPRSRLPPTRVSPLSLLRFLTALAAPVPHGCVARIPLSPIGPLHRRRSAGRSHAALSRSVFQPARSGGRLSCSCSDADARVHDVVALDPPAGRKHRPTRPCPTGPCGTVRCCTPADRRTDKHQSPHSGSTHSHASCLSARPG